jgi:hypothetical protein
LVIRWRLGIPATVLAFAALHALAQGPGSATWPDCPECQTAAGVVERDKEETARLEKRLDEAAIGSPERAQALDRLVRRQDILSADEKTLSDCRTRCALRGPLPPLPPEIILVRHAEPVACPECNDAAVRAREALVKLTYAEHNYLSDRYTAFQARSWLSLNPKTIESTSAYFTKLSAYLEMLSALSKSESALASALAAFDRAVQKLADCNATLCTDAFKAGMQPPVGAAENDPKAECADCEGAALKLKRDLALLRVAKAEISQGKATPDEQVPIEREIEADRAALDACNKAHPRTSCQPPTGPSGTQGTGAAVGTGGATGQQKKGDGIKRPAVSIVDDLQGPEFPERDLHPADTGSPSVRDQLFPRDPLAPDRLPDTKTPPSKDVPPPGLPSTGSIFAPTPGVPGGQRFNLVTKPFVDQDDDEDCGEWVEYFTFEVRGDERFKDDLLENPFFADKDVISSKLTWNQVTVSGGANPGKTYEFLKNLMDRGLIKNLESELDVCWRAAASGSSVPVAGSWVLYTPVSPTPSSNPGERPGDEGPPTAVRVGRDGTYTAPPRGRNGPIEMRVAKGWDERTTMINVGTSDRAPAAGVTPPVEERPDSDRRIINAIRASELRMP